MFSILWTVKCDENRESNMKLPVMRLLNKFLQLPSTLYPIFSKKMMNVLPLKSRKGIIPKDGRVEYAQCFRKFTRVFSFSMDCEDFIIDQSCSWSLSTLCQTGPGYRRYSNGSSVGTSEHMEDSGTEDSDGFPPRDSRILDRELSSRPMMSQETHVIISKPRSQRSTLKTCFKRSEQNGLGKSRRTSWGR